MVDSFININLEEIEDLRAPIPKSVYHVRVKSVEKKQKPGEGKYPYLDIRLTPLEFPKKTLFLNLSFHPEALWNLKEFVVKSKTPHDPRKGFNYQDINGRELRVTVDEEPSQDDPSQMRNVVKPPYHSV